MPGQGSGSGSAVTPNPGINGKTVTMWEPDSADTATAAITQAVGAASMCWSPTPTGEFDSTKALSVVNGLVAWLRASGVQIS